MTGSGTLRLCVMCDVIRCTCAALWSRCYMISLILSYLGHTVTLLPLGGLILGGLSIDLVTWSMVNEACCLRGECHLLSGAGNILFEELSNQLADHAKFCKPGSTSDAMKAFTCVKCPS